MYYVNYPTCFPLFIQFMQSYGKYNNVQKFFSFFVYYRRVWHSAIPTQPPTTETEKQEGVRIAERKAVWVWQDAIPS